MPDYVVHVRECDGDRGFYATLEHPSTLIVAAGDAAPTREGAIASLRSRTEAIHTRQLQAFEVAK